MNALACLRRYPLFGLLPQGWFQNWVSSGQVQDVAVGEVLCQEGTTASWVCVVLEGRVRVLRRTPSDRDVTLGNYLPGDVFGEYGLLRPYQNTATCRAAMDTRLLRLPLGELRQAIKANPNLHAVRKNWLRLHGLAAYLRGRSHLGFMSGTSALTHLDHLQSTCFPAGDTVQAEGLNADRWFYVDSGDVKVQPWTGEPYLLSAGDCFGERALAGLADLPTAVAQTALCCRFLSVPGFAPDQGADAPSTVQTFKPQLSPMARQKCWVGQEAEADCGLACLVMLARLARQDVSLADLQARIQPGQQGLSMLELEREARAIGLRALAVRVQQHRLAEVHLPAIAHQRSGHYVVVFHAGLAGVLVGDPASGVSTMSQAVFCESWSGHLLLVPSVP